MFDYITTKKYNAIKKELEYFQRRAENRKLHAQNIDTIETLKAALVKVRAENSILKTEFGEEVDRQVASIIRRLQRDYSGVPAPRIVYNPPGFNLVNP